MATAQAAISLTASVFWLFAN